MCTSRWSRRRITGIAVLALLAADVVLAQGLTAPAVPDPARCQEHGARLPVAGATPVFGRASPDEWAVLIDDTWGPGRSAAEETRVFDTIWQVIDEDYGAFMNLAIDLTAFRDRYRPEIVAGVSRGRFAAILNQLSIALQDAHTYLLDQEVNWATEPAPGVPLFAIGGWLSNERFGAALTPLPDGTLLVYKVVPGQVLGLEPGDLVLGYDGVPWPELYRQLLAAELPIHLSWVCGSTPASMDHCMMMSAGLNWHLFDTLDVVKYASGETLHLPTSPLAFQRGRILGNEQLPVAGVEMPDFWADDFISWGIIAGTRIGYIYVASWSPDPRFHISQQFRAAILALMNDTDGLIIDFRFNMGGYMLEAHNGYRLLFNETVTEIGFDLRGDPADHLDMVPHPTYTPELFTIPGDPSTFYDHPIAVLTGPGAVSNGDWESLRTRFHPRVRTFGLPSNGAFTLSDSETVAPYWFVTRAIGSGYLIDGHVYLAHTGVQPDERVWLDRDDVAHGVDTVVEAAIAWIRSTPRRPAGRLAPSRP